MPKKKRERGGEKERERKKRERKGKGIYSYTCVPALFRVLNTPKGENPLLLMLLLLGDDGNVVGGIGGKGTITEVEEGD